MENHIVKACSLLLMKRTAKVVSLKLTCDEVELIYATEGSGEGASPSDRHSK